jgi:sugar phosphate permease
MVAIPVSGFLGSQFSAWLLSFDGLFGYQGWQWLFVAEGLQIVLLGIACLFILTDRPEQASRLTLEQRTWLTTRLQGEREAARRMGDASPWQLAVNGYFWRLVLACSAVLAAGSVLWVWQPQLIKARGFDDVQTGLLNSIPYGVASVL